MFHTPSYPTQQLTPPPAPTHEQRVEMMRSEVELYVRDRRPTGLLLRSVACLKGMTAASIANASGQPQGVVLDIMKDHGLAGIKEGALRKVAAVIGIDLTTMRLAQGHVHVFDLRRLKGVGRTECEQAMRAVGLLVRGSIAARLSVELPLMMRLAGVVHHVAEHTSGEGRVTQALFVSGRRHRFDINAVPGGTWVKTSESDSTVQIPSGELVGHLLAQSLTVGEFGDLFKGDQALTWDDVIVASRVNGISKAELLEFIKRTAADLDARDLESAKVEVLQPRPVLALVGSEAWGTTRRLAANG